MSKAKTDKADAARLPFAGLMQTIDPGAFAAIQQRNTVAASRVAKLVSDTVASIGAHQMEFMKAMTSIPMPTAKAPTDADGVSALVQDEIKTGRTVLEKTIEQARQINDAVIQCCYGVVEEFEACTEDHWQSLANGLDAGAGKSKSASETAQTKPRAVSA